MTTGEHDPTRPTGRQAYKCGCRCPDCSAAQREYNRVWSDANRAKLNAQSLARKARARRFAKIRETVEQRLAYGWTVTRIMRELDVDYATVKTVRDYIEAIHAGDACSNAERRRNTERAA
jgi:hypothetical protein